MESGREQWTKAFILLPSYLVTPFFLYNTANRKASCTSAFPFIITTWAPSSDSNIRHKEFQSLTQSFDLV